MIRTLNPPALAKLSGQATIGILHGALAKRLLVAPQIGLQPNGTMVEGLDQQIDQALDNLAIVLRAAGLTVSDIARLTVHTRIAGAAAACAQRCLAKVSPARPIAVSRETSGFARPDCLVEIECEAIREA